MTIFKSRSLLLAILFLSAIFAPGALPAQGGPAISNRTAPSNPPTTSNSPEHDYLQSKVGHWSVIMTLRPLSDATPIIIKGLAADRAMIGDYCLHEVMHPVPGTGVPDFQRLADLAYNVNEQRWDYMSIDSRITAGIMYFTYLGSHDSTISSFIASFPHPGFGPDHVGRGMAVYMRNEVIRIDKDHDMVRQYWRTTDKPEWLGVQYAYSRGQ